MSMTEFDGRQDKVLHPGIAKHVVGSSHLTCTGGTENPDRLLPENNGGVDHSAVHSDCHLPVEVWKNIIEDHLGLAAIKVMSLVCKTLRSLALPVMFYRLELSLDDDLDPESDENSQPYDEDELLLDDRQLERLEFFTSDAIRHMVRDCSVKNYSGLLLQAEAIDPDYHKLSNQTTILIERYLCHLFNLELLEFAHTYFGKGSLEALMTLPALWSLTLNDCSIRLATPLLSPLRLQLRQLGFFDIRSMPSSQWDALVNPDHLETLIIGFSMLPTWLPARDLPHLLHLHLISCEVPPDYPPMRTFPQLETLAYYPPQHGPQLIFSGAPKLKQYNGPLQSLSSSLSRGIIEELVVPFAEETKDVAQKLLEFAPSNPQLQSLQMQADHSLTHSLLETFCLFPALRDLKLDVTVIQASTDTVESPDGFMSKFLALPLPPLIERISVNFPRLVGYGHPDLQEYKEQLSSWVARYPELRYVEIPGWRMWGRGKGDCKFTYEAND